MFFQNLFFCFVCIITWFSSVRVETNGCVFRHKCGEMVNTFGLTVPIPCVYNGLPAKFLNSSSVSIVAKYMPEWVSNQESHFCCDDEQIEQLENQMEIPRKLLDRCPSCYYNYVRLFLLMTCSPNQRQFLHVTSSNASTGRDQQQMVLELDYHLTPEYSHGLYNSCSEVILPATGAKVVTVVMCQPLRPSESCNTERFLKAIGAKGVSPFKINFNYYYNDNSFTPINHTIVRCNEVPNTYSNQTCSCVDCSATCPVSVNTVPSGL